MVGEDVGASRGVQLVVPGATSVLTEAGMLTSMRRGEIVADPEECVAIRFSRDEVVADVREFSMSPEVFGKTERRMFVLGHRQEGR